MIHIENIVIALLTVYALYITYLFVQMYLDFIIYFSNL